MGKKSKRKEKANPSAKEPLSKKEAKEPLSKKELIKLPAKTKDGDSNSKQAHAAGQCRSHSDNKVSNNPSLAHRSYGGKDSEGSKEEENRKEAKHFTDVCKHMLNYATHSFERFEKLEKDFDLIDTRLQALVPGHKDKLKEVRKLIVKNHEFLREVIRCARPCFEHAGTNYSFFDRQPWRCHEERASKVRSTIRQCARDWSKHGAPERELCYGPIMKELERLYPDKSKRGEKRVLIPGNGLGRLTWDICKIGFEAQGNEFSYFMLLTSYYILNCLVEVDELTLHPWISDSRNLWSSADQLRSVQIPDVDPRSLPKGSRFSMVAGDFLEVYAPQVAEWDIVTTCFFLDTANNILEYLRMLTRILKVGGHWINFGPLLYHYADTYGELSIELSYEELKATFAQFGFELINEKKNLPSSYTGNDKSMLQQMYSCVFFTCKKVKDVHLAQF